MQVKKLPFLLLIIAVASGCDFASRLEARVPNSKRINSIATIIDDIKSPHEGMPRGVPEYYDWAKKPLINRSSVPKRFKAMTAWGQIYESAKGNSATNTRVQIRNMKTYMLSKKDGKWYPLQTTKKIEGAAFRENYARNVNKPANLRRLPDGTIAVKPGNGYNYHFWPKGRAKINPNDVKGIFTTVQARLIVDNPKKADDRSKARYLLSMGGDYWVNLSVGWDNFKSSDGIGTGKFKYVTPEWQAFNMTTLSPEEIRRNPPPMD